MPPLHRPTRFSRDHLMAPPDSLPKNSASFPEGGTNSQSCFGMGASSCVPPRSPRSPLVWALLCLTTATEAFITDTSCRSVPECHIGLRLSVRLCHRPVVTKHHLIFTHAASRVRHAASRVRHFPDQWQGRLLRRKPVQARPTMAGKPVCLFVFVCAPMLRVTNSHFGRATLPTTIR